MRYNYKTYRIIPVVLSMLMFFVWGCNNGSDEFKHTSGGLTYKFHKQNKAGIGLLKGDMVTADVVFRTIDTVFFVSSRDLSVPYQFEILEPKFPGDIYDALLVMAVGDSATFIIDGDSLFLFDFEIQDYPDFITPETEVFMDVKVQDVMPQEDFLLEKNAYRDRLGKMRADLKEKEENDIRSYLEENDFNVNPTESGLYYIELKKGSGPAVEPGKFVKVDYSAMFINGEIFETTKQDIAVKYNIFDSLLNYQPFRYLQGDTLTIAGWNEGLSFMNQGGRGLLVIPSALAYGEQGIEGLIPPFTPLIYDVEILEVK